MHTCLSLAKVDNHWDAEHPISDLLARLDAYCGSIDWCNIAVEGPNGEADARCWRVNVKLRISDETVRASAQVLEGSDSAQSLSRALADVYARATEQIAQVVTRSTAHA